MIQFYSYILNSVQLECSNNEKEHQWTGEPETCKFVLTVVYWKFVLKSWPSVFLIFSENNEKDELSDGLWRTHFYMEHEIGSTLSPFLRPHQDLTISYQSKNKTSLPATKWSEKLSEREVTLTTWLAFWRSSCCDQSSIQFRVEQYSCGS